MADNTSKWGKAAAQKRYGKAEGGSIDADDRAKLSDMSAQTAKQGTTRLPLPDPYQGVGSNVSRGTLKPQVDPTGKNNKYGP